MEILSRCGRCNSGRLILQIHRANPWYHHLGLLFYVTCLCRSMQKMSMIISRSTTRNCEPIVLYLYNLANNIHLFNTCWNQSINKMKSLLDVLNTGKQIVRPSITHIEKVVRIILNLVRSNIEIFLQVPRYAPTNLVTSN